MPFKLNDRWIALGLGILAFALYANTLSNGYNMDDELVTRNHVFTSQGIKAIPEIFRSPYYADEAGNYYGYRPLVHVSFAIEHELFGEVPGTGHGINSLLYALTIFLLFIVLRRLFQGYSIWLPLLATLLFAVHPLHTEVVASLKNRDELLSFGFGLLAMYSAQLSVEAKDWRRLLFLLVPLLLAAGLLSKATILAFAWVIPAALVLFGKADGLKASFLAVLLALVSYQLLQQSPMVKGVVALTIVLAPVLLAGLLTPMREWQRSIQLALKQNLQEIAAFISPVADLVVKIGGVKKLGQNLNRLEFAGASFRFPSAVSLALSVLAVIALVASWFLEAGELIGLAVVSTTAGFWFSSKRFHLLFLTLTGVVGILAGPYFSFPFLAALSPLPFLWWLMKRERIDRGSLLPALSFAVAFVDPLTSWVVPLHIFIFGGSLFLFFRPGWRWSGAFLPLLASLGFLISPWPQLCFPALLFLVFLLLTEAGARAPAMIRVSILSWALAGILASVLLPVHPASELRGLISGVHSPVEQQVPVPDRVYSQLFPNQEAAGTGERPGRVMDFSENPLVNESRLDKRLGTSAVIAGQYLKLCVVPYPLRFYYGYDTIEVVGLEDWRAILSLLLHVLLVIGAIALFRKEPVVSLGVLIYLLAIFPFVNLVVLVAGIIGERFAYLPSLGICLLIAFPLVKYLAPYEGQPWRFIGIRPKIFLGLVILLAGIGSWQTIERNRLWKDTQTLFRHDIPLLERSTKAHNLLATHCARDASEERDAVRKGELLSTSALHFGKSIEIYPEFPFVWFDLGRVLMMQGEIEKATKAFKESARRDSTYAMASFYAGNLLEEQQALDQAAVYYRQAINRDPDYPEPYNSLSFLYFRQGDYENSISVNQLAVAAMPTQYAPRVNLGKTYLFLGDTTSALTYFEQAWSLNSQDQELNSNLINLLLAAGDTSKARYYQNGGN